MGWNWMEPNDGLAYIWGKLFQKELTENVLLFRTKKKENNNVKMPSRVYKEKESYLVMQIAFGLEEQQNCSCPEHLKGL